MKRRVLRRWPGAASSAQRIGPCAPSPEPRVEPFEDALEKSNAISEHLATLSHELDQSIERLGRICDDIDLKRESERITPAQEDMDPVAGAGASDLSAALTGIVSRFDALCARLEPCVDQLEHLVASFEERAEEKPPSPDVEAIASIGRPTDQSPPLTSGPDELGVLREEVWALVSRLQRGIVGDHGLAVELQAIRSLRERLDGFLQKLQAEEQE